MSTPSRRKSAENMLPVRSPSSLRTTFWVSGAVALVVGMLVLAWPTKTAQVVTAMVAVYAIVGGVVYLSLGLFSRTRTAGPRVGLGLLGGLFVAVGIVAWANFGRATLWLGDLAGILVGVLWIVEAVVAVATTGTARSSSGTPRSRAWTLAFAAVSAVAGVVLLLTPVWGVAMLWWVFGASLVVLGVVQIARASELGPAPRAKDS